MSVALSLKTLHALCWGFYSVLQARPNLSQCLWYWKRSARLCLACKTKVRVLCLLLQKLCLQFGCLRQSYFLPSLLDCYGFSRANLQIYHACACVTDSRQWNPSTADTHDITDSSESPNCTQNDPGLVEICRPFQQVCPPSLLEFNNFTLD